jgi:sarcosine oxidase
VHVETIVIGLGAMGSATVYQLAKRGRPVLGIDQFAPPHARGSTHGETRITRQAIGEGEHYSPFAIRSHELWREIEHDAECQLLTLTGGLIISSGAGIANMHVPDFLATTLAAAKRYNIPHELLSAAEIRTRFPAFNVRDEEAGYFEPSAGFLRPEDCVAAQLGLAERYGATLHRSEKVVAIRQDRAHVMVRTDATTYVAEHVILTTGPWIPDFVGPERASLFSVTRQVLYWFAPTEVVTPFLPGRFPVFIWEPHGGTQAIYGFPAIPPVGGIKIASGAYGERTTAAIGSRAVTVEETTAMYQQLVAPCFPGLSPRCLKTVSCLYTVTPDAGFVIDRHPEYHQVLLVSPCSGHGFKHSAAIGEAVAELVANGASRLDVSRFGIGRFRSAEDRVSDRVESSMADA